LSHVALSLRAVITFASHFYCERWCALEKLHSYIAYIKGCVGAEGFSMREIYFK
jgi:hypothetical protein